MNDPIDISSSRIVFPVDRSLHKFYSFYIKVTAEGSSNAFFGAYDLYVGCFASSVTFSDSPSLVKSVPMFVNGNVTAVYTFIQPVSTRSYCMLENTTIYHQDKDEEW